MCRTKEAVISRSRGSSPPAIAASTAVVIESTPSMIIGLPPPRHRRSLCAACSHKDRPRLPVVNTRPNRRNLRLDSQHGDAEITMNVTRFAAAPAYPAPPDHHGMACLRLQGMSAGPSGALWLSLSQIEPGGFIERGASPLEKHYVVLAGEVTVVTDDGEAVLGLWDSVRLAVSSP